MKKRYYVIILIILFATSVFGLITYDVYSFGKLSGDICYSFTNSASETCVANIDKVLFRSENIDKKINSTDFSILKLYYSEQLKKYICYGFKNGNECVLITDGETKELHLLPQSVFDMKVSDKYIIITTDIIGGKYSLRYFDLSTDLNNLNSIESYVSLYESTSIIRFQCDSDNSHCVFSDKSSIYVWNYNDISKMTKDYADLVYYGENYYALWNDGKLSMYDSQTKDVVWSEVIMKPAFVFISSYDKAIIATADEKEVFAGNQGISKYMEVVDLKSGNSRTLKSNFFVRHHYIGAFEKNN